MSSAAASAPVTATETQRSSWVLPIVALAHRELVRFFRQRTRIVGAVGQPVIFWVLFGTGLGESFRAPGWASQLETPLSYQEYFFPGIAVLIILFTAIFSTISIIEDRREGFLQGVLAAPIPRSALVLGKLLGGAILALTQTTLFLVLGPLLSAIGLAPELSTGLTLSNAALVFPFLFLIAIELTALGFLIAWPMDSTQGFHAIMSVLLFPMWLVSGAFFPGTSDGWMAWLIRLNPLSYGVAGLRRLMSPVELPTDPLLPAASTCLLVTAVTTAVLIASCAAVAGRRRSPDAR